jgi:hypothetical protein
LKHYRFHVRDAFGIVEDEEGMALPDLYAALAEALHCVGELMADPPSLPRMQFEISDEIDRVLLIVPIYGAGDSAPRKEQALAA